MFNNFKVFNYFDVNLIKIYRISDFKAQHTFIPVFTFGLSQEFRDRLFVNDFHRKAPGFHFCLDFVAGLQFRPFEDF